MTLYFNKKENGKLALYLNKFRVGFNKVASHKYTGDTTYRIYFGYFNTFITVRKARKILNT